MDKQKKFHLQDLTGSIAEVFQKTKSEDLTLIYTEKGKYEAITLSFELLKILYFKKAEHLKQTSRLDAKKYSTRI